MKRWPWMALAALLVGVGVHGAGEEAARAAADQAAAEERFRILRSAVDDLLVAQMELRQKLGDLTKALEKVSAEARSRPGVEQYVTRQEFEKLVESVRELDRKREADRRLILEQIGEMEEIVTRGLRSATQAPVRASQTPSSGGPTGSQEGVEYVVEKGNTLSAIIVAHNAAFKEQGRKTSLQLILDANPGLEPTTMQVGRKLFIPMVPIKP